jgi:hypothetical protein
MSSAPAPAVTPQAILMPERAFADGMLTGVVLGPDDQPVPDAPVQVAAGGVPGALSGEVLGDEPGQQSNPPVQGQSTPGQPASPAEKTATSKNRGPGPGFLSCPPSNLMNERQIPSQSANGQGPANQSMPITHTDKFGRFALCVLPAAAKVSVNVPGVAASPATTAEVPVLKEPAGVRVLTEPPEFVQPEQKFTLSGLFPKGGFNQNGKQGYVPIAFATDASGSHSISTIKVPRTLQPGFVSWTLSDPTGKQVNFHSGIFKILSASMDRSKLRSHQVADFDFEVLADPQTIPNGLCVDVEVSGPITIVQSPPTHISIDSSGHGKFGGKIQATPVAPGSTVPFGINTNFYGCKS